MIFPERYAKLNVPQSAQNNLSNILTKRCGLLIIFKTKPDRTPVAVLTDLSKFGTWLNNVKLNNGEEKLLSNGDQIMFGSPKSSFMWVQIKKINKYNNHMVLGFVLWY